MHDARKTNAQLIDELAELRLKVAALEAADTERMRAEAALRESEELHRITMENISDPVFMTDDAGRFTFICSNVQHILGYSTEEIQQKGNIAWFLGADVFKTEDLKRQGELRNIERVIVLKDGSEHIFLITVKQVAIQGGTVLFTCHDITERKQAEEQIKNQNIVLEQAVQQKQQEMEDLFERLLRQEKLATIGQMAGSIAHELRNPLGAVKQSVYYLKRLAQTQELTASNPKVLHHLELMDTELTTSARVIADLLDMTHMKPPQRVQTDLRTIIADAVARSQLPEQVRVSITLEPEPFLIYADPLQLRQVVLNVLTNAAQAITEEGLITIHAKQLTQEGESVIKIHDTGVGVAPETLPNVFEPLYTTKANGTGLGLSICKQIIESHQGRISLTSQPEQGATVTIILPRNDMKNMAH